MNDSCIYIDMPTGGIRKQFEAHRSPRPTRLMIRTPDMSPGVKKKKRKSRTLSAHVALRPRRLYIMCHEHLDDSLDDDMANVDTLTSSLTLTEKYNHAGATIGYPWGSRDDGIVDSWLHHSYISDMY